MSLIYLLIVWVSAWTMNWWVLLVLICFDTYLHNQHSDDEVE